MMNIVGLMAFSAKGSALNNIGNEPGTLTDNTVGVKKIRTINGVYPYVSGQAWRYWWRNTLTQKFGWKMSPITREKKIAFTEANPIKYPDDDLFGYMRAKKIEIDVNGKKKKINDTLTRISPLKNSPLISIAPSRPSNDFGVMNRQNGDPVPFEHELYMCDMRGLFSIDVDNASVFSSENRAGAHNLHVKMLKTFKEDENLIVNEGNGTVSLKKETKLARISDVLKTLPYLYGGANSTLHLTDVTPQLLIFTLFNGGNHIFSHLLTEKDKKPTFSFEELKRICEDYKSDLLTKIYISVNSNFIDLTNKSIKESLTSNKIDNKLFEFGTAKTNLDKFCKVLDKKI